MLKKRKVETLRKSTFKSGMWHHSVFVEPNASYATQKFRERATIFRRKYTSLEVRLP
jgi:hypothetical protein